MGRVCKKPSREIAESLVSYLQERLGDSALRPYIKEIRVEGAGFINFYLQEIYFYQQLNAILEKGREALKADAGGGSRVLIEFVSANPTGPLHVAHARGAIVGDALANLVRNKLKIKRIRSDTFGYLQRSFLGVVSHTDALEAREVGEKAVQFAVWHNVDGSVAIRRTGDYSVEYFLTPLDTVAKDSKSMPREFINAEGNDVTTAFKNYARPLVGDLADYDRISAPSVTKILRR